MSLGAKVPLEVKRGCDFTSDTFVWTDGDGVNSGTGLPIDLTTATASLVIATSPSAGDTVLLTIVSPTNITLGGTNGTIIITLSKATIDASLPQGNYWYDLIITIGGVSYPVMNGTFAVEFSAGF